MSRISTVRVLISTNMPAIAIVLVLVAILGGRAISAQDKYTVQVPNGISLSEFRGIRKLAGHRDQ